MMVCQHCQKCLSRKTARQIDGVVLCSTCLFKPAKERAPIQLKEPEE